MNNLEQIVDLMSTAPGYPEYKVQLDIVIEMIETQQDDELIVLLDLLVTRWAKDVEEYEKRGRSRRSDPISWRYTRAIQRVLDHFATGDNQAGMQALFDHIEVYTKLFYRGNHGATLTEFAIKLIVTHEFKTVEALLAHNLEAATGFCAVMLHELVIEGFDVASSEVLTQVANYIRESNHPLKKLPLLLLLYERDIPTRRPRYQGLKWSPFKLNYYQDIPYRPIGNVTTSHTLIGTDDIYDDAALSVFNHAREYSNGMVEIRRYLLANPVTVDDITGTTLLLTTDAESLAGLTPDTLRLYHSQPYEVLRLLFAFGSMRGAYSRGNGNAYGRLLMWESLAGLMQRDTGTPIARLHDALDDYEWFEFEPISDWFDEVGGLLGLIVLNKQEQILTVLAFSDSD